MPMGWSVRYSTDIPRQVQYDIQWFSSVAYGCRSYVGDCRPHSDDECLRSREIVPANLTTADGTIDFKFVELHPEQVPETVQKRFDPGFVAWYFANNRDPDYKPPACQK